METVIIRGAGDLASGVGYRLFKSGFKVLFLEIEKPLSIRRTVCFSEAVYKGEIEIEGVRGKLANDLEAIYKIIGESNIPVYIDPKAEIIDKIKPLAVIDCIMAKKNIGTNRGMANITIAIGPGFEAGLDVDLVVETKRGHYLGRVIYEGKAEENTGIPGETLGYREERIIRAKSDGLVKNYLEIGDFVKENDLICTTGDEEVRANISGVIRGLITEGLIVAEGLKIGDIDPRGELDYAYTISDKALAIGGGVLEGILYLKKERGL